MLIAVTANLLDLAALIFAAAVDKKSIVFRLAVNIVGKTFNSSAAFDKNRGSSDGSDKEDD